ncbi:MAG: hypothetical protein ACYTFG_07775 [Planctomycetota bacterium]|jgi:YHS domain-containing protein
MEKNKFALLGFVAFGAMLLVLAGCAGDKGTESQGRVEDDSGLVNAKTPTVGADVKLRPQESCPIMGGGIDKNVFVEHGGKRIYFCCGGCEAEFKKDPEKYFKVLEDRGEMVEDVLQ